MIVANGWDFNQMQRILLVAIIVANVTSIAHHALAQTKTVVRRDDDRSISVTTHERRFTPRDLVRTAREPAPPNNCPTPAFEIASGSQRGMCVGF
jgi:hypothetical protein